MNRTGRVLTASVVVVALVAAFAYSARTSAQDTDSRQKWEYLIVADGGNSLNSVSSPGQRKQKDFGREAVTVERNLDRLGADGWELVSVLGSPNEPTFMLKRQKH